MLDDVSRQDVGLPAAVAILVDVLGGTAVAGLNLDAEVFERAAANVDGAVARERRVSTNRSPWSIATNFLYLTSITWRHPYSKSKNNAETGNLCLNCDQRGIKRGEVGASSR